MANEPSDIPLQEELAKLQRLNHARTIRLRQLGLDVDVDLPANFIASLNEYVAIQQETGLLSLGDTQLEQWYQDRKLDAINVAECLAADRAHCNQLEHRLAAVNKEKDSIKALLEVAEREYASPTEYERSKEKINADITQQSYKLHNMQKVPEGIHLVDIMEKSKELKKLRAASRY